MKFTSLLLLLGLGSLPLCAAPIRYQVGNGGSVWADFTAPDFLPNVSTSTPRHWTLSESEFTGFNCFPNRDPFGSARVCSQLDIDAPIGGQATFTLSYYTPGFDQSIHTELIGSFITDLSTFGFVIGGGHDLTIFPGNVVTFAPEPGTWLLLACGLSLLLWTQKSRRLTRNQRPTRDIQPAASLTNLTQIETERVYLS